MKIAYKNNKYDIRDSLITKDGEFRLVVTNLEECVGCAFLDDETGCLFLKEIHTLSCLNVVGGIYMLAADIKKNERLEKLNKIFNGTI